MQRQQNIHASLKETILLKKKGKKKGKGNKDYSWGEKVNQRL